MSPSKKTVTPANREKTPSSKGFFSNIQWGESYVSLFLGAVVVIVAAALGLFYVKLHQPQGQILPPVQIVKQVQLTVTPNASISAQHITPTNTVSYPTQITPKPTVTQVPTITQKPKPTFTPSKKNSPTPTKKQQIPSPKTISPTPAAGNNKNQKTYVVQKNDDLWNIAIKEYGSGYSWVSIAQANHLANPGKIFSGDTLIIPSVTPILVHNNAISVTPSQAAHVTKPVQPTVTVTPTPIPGTTITGTHYTVQKGDTLWDISVKAYGNGYKWINIAQANHLTNPSVIHSGNVLIIPRSQTL